MSSRENSQLNTPDEHGNAPLHNAVIQNDMEMLNHLLQQSDIDLNYKNYKGETPLVLSLRMFRIDSFVLRLIKAGSDLNLTNKFGQTSLHVALLCSSVTIAHELVESGANINARDLDKRSPLHYAVDNDDLEAVCMLLSYGADVSILCKENMTAFTLALYCNRFDLAEVLFDYYDEFSDRDLDGYTALHLAVWHENPLAERLVKAGADVNCVTYDGGNVLTFSLAYCSSELFKLIWPRFDQRLLLENEPFLVSFISDSGFVASDWVECMYLILDSPLAFELFDHYRNYYIVLSEGSISYNHCFHDILQTFENLGVQSTDRSKIMACCLSFGWEIVQMDINYVFEVYGFNEELELFIYATDYFYQTSREFSSFFYAVPKYIFSLDSDPDVEELTQSFHNQIGTTPSINPTQSFINCLGFFSLPRYTKEELLCQCKVYCFDCQMVKDRFDTIPEFPSLLELSRNRARQFLRQSCKITRTYHIHDAIKRLRLPRSMQDILRFKTPLYR